MPTDDARFSKYFAAIQNDVPKHNLQHCISRRSNAPPTHPNTSAAAPFFCLLDRVAVTAATRPKFYSFSPSVRPRTSMAPADEVLRSLAFVSFVRLGACTVHECYSQPFLRFRHETIAPPWHRHFPTLTRRPRTTSCCRSPQKLPASSISVRDSATGARILLVGCVHGSRVSADDVRKVLDGTSPDAVILELCESRLQTLRTVVLQTTAKNQRLSKGFESRKRQSFAQLSSTFGGAGPAIVAFCLDTVYRLQIMAGVDPGIEFVEPIRRYNGSRIVCGDAPACDTVEQLFNVFINPIKSVTGSLASIRDLVGRVLLPPRGGINMATLFLTDTARLAEMARLLLPITVISTLISVVGNAGAAALDSAPGISGLSGLKYDSTGILFPTLWAVAEMLSVAYVIVSMLRFMKVLISDRDRILTQSILDTAAKLRSETNREVTVCAVVGLLHANGILRLLEEHNRAL